MDAPSPSQPPPLDLRRGDVDGITTFWCPGPGPLTVALVFGVGTVDEPLRHRGVNHLVEHLSLHGLDHRLTDFNGQVTHATTSFLASGTTDEVNGVLAHVGRSLAHLDTTRLDRERTVLRTEAQGRAPTIVGQHLLMRYGNLGLGTIDARELGLWTLEPTDLVEWTRRWFVGANAALAVSGPAPEGLHLDLPDGIVQTRIPAPPDLIDRPTWFRTRGDFVGFSAVGPHGAAWSMALGALSVASEDRLREQDGRSYSVVQSRAPVGVEHTFAYVSADCMEGAGVAVRDGMSVVLNRLRDSGPATKELDIVRVLVRRGATDQRAAMSFATNAAEAHVGGREPITPADHLEQCDQVDADQIARVLDDAHARGLWSVPNDAEVTDRRYEMMPNWSDERIDGTAYQPGEQRDPRVAGHRLVIGPDGAMLDVDGNPVTVRWNDLQAACRYTDWTWTLFGSDGFTLSVSARSWYRGADAVADVQMYVPRDLIVDLDEAALPDVPDIDPARPIVAGTAPSTSAAQKSEASDTGAPVGGPFWTRERKLQARLFALLFVIAGVTVAFIDDASDMTTAGPTLVVAALMGFAASAKRTRR